MRGLRRLKLAEFLSLVQFKKEQDLYMTHYVRVEKDETGKVLFPQSLKKQQYFLVLKYLLFGGYLLNKRINTRSVLVGDPITLTILVHFT